MNRWSADTDECRYPSSSRLVADLADIIAQALVRSLRQRGSASLVVSGGSTPAPLFDALARVELDWSRVSVTLADERWVAPDHADSNEALVRSRLLVGKAAAASFVSLYEHDCTAQLAGPAVSHRVAAMPRPFDVVLLGMGNDGHTASFFPGDPLLARALEEGAGHCMGMQPPADTRGRMTLTLQALLQSQRIIVFITGQEKWRLYRTVAAAEADAVARWPVKAVLAQKRTPVSVFWSP